MSKHHQRQVLFVLSLLDKPKWYNETITHRNWPMIKRAIKTQKPFELVNLPPKIQEIEDHKNMLYRKYYGSQVLMAKPPMFMVTGVTA